VAKPVTDAQERLFSAKNLYADLLREGSAEMAVQRHLAPMLADEDFEAMYKDGGRPPVSPKILALVSLLQTMDRIPDREAAYDATVRLDWQVIFGVDPGWTGFDPSLLTVFRRRMLAHPGVKDLFDRVLEKLIELKLVRPEGKQRLDSTWVFGLLRTLSRLENLKEALRVALRAIEERSAEGASFVKGLPAETWKRAMRKMDLRGLDGQERQELTLTLGRDIVLVLGRIETASEDLKGVPEVETLRRIFEQNFTVHRRKRGKRGRKRTVVKLRDFTETPGQDRISSPHEPEARYNTKADKSRGAIGYKIQVAETAEPDRPNFITEVEVTGGATPDDGQAGKVVETLQKKDLAPAALHVDSGYVSRAERRDLKEEHGVDLVGPTKAQAAAGIASDPVRVPVERTINEFVGNGARYTPYRGRRKTRWWERMIGAVINLKRLSRAEAAGLLRAPPGMLSPLPA
jgi:transposase